MIKKVKFGNFKPTGESINKKQIILCHSSRGIENYLNSIQYRFNGKFKRIPNYIIDKNGEIYELLSELEYSDFFSDKSLNENSVVIVLENLGWLQKEPLKDYYVNWIGDIYKGKVFEKKWRDYFFWDPYSEEQIKSLVNLCKDLFESLNIEDNIIEHNVKITGIEDFKGVVTRSNFNTNYTDLSPSFDFQELNKKIRNE